MNVLLREHNTVVDVPDDTSDKQLSEINDNLPKYLAPSSTGNGNSGNTGNSESVVNSPETTPKPENTTVSSPQPEPTRQWVPDFYNGYVKPLLDKARLSDQSMENLEEIITNPDPTPAGQVFEGKAVEGLTFGLTKPLIEPAIRADEPAHPIAAFGGELAGGLGSLATVGGALRVATALPRIAEATAAMAEPTFAAAGRFIPPAIMQGATFGTKTFIDKTVKMFQDGNVNLAEFGRHVMGPTVIDTIAGAGLGVAGKIEGIKTAMASAAGLGFTSAKMQGASNAQAVLQATIWGLYEAVGGQNRSEELRLGAISHLGDTVGDHLEAVAAPGELGATGGRAVGKAIVDAEIKKQGFNSAEDLAKNGPENTLNLIEGINQKVRGAVIQKPAEPAPESGFKVTPAIGPLAEGQKVESEASKEQPLPTVGEEKNLGGIQTGLSTPPSPQPIGPIPPPLEGSHYGASRTPDEVFPPTKISSEPSISQHPDYKQITSDAEAIVRKYAAERDIPATAQLGEKIFHEIHNDQNDTTRAIFKAKTPEERKAIKAEFDKKWPDSQNEFATLQSKLYSDNTTDWFQINEAGKYGAMRPQVAIEADKAAGIVPKEQAKSPLPEPDKEAVNIYLIEHGETNIDKAGENHGIFDPGVNETGVQQSQKVADALAPLKLNRIYSAGSQRANDTAKIIGDATNAKVVPKEGLKSIDKGAQSSGMKKEELAKIMTGLLDKASKNPEGTLLGGKETFPDAEKRIVAALKDTVFSHSAGNRIGLVVNSDVAQIMRNMAKNGGAPSTPEQIKNFLDKESIEPGDVSVLKYHPETGDIEIVKEKALGGGKENVLPRTSRKQVESSNVPHKRTMQMQESARKNEQLLSSLPREIHARLEEIASIKPGSAAANELPSLYTRLREAGQDQETALRELREYFESGTSPRLQQAIGSDVALPSLSSETSQKLSPEDIAQMAYDRGLIEEPDVDLLKLAPPEVQEGNFSIAPSASVKEPPLIKQVADNIKESHDEIRNLVMPDKAKPLAAEIGREQLGKLARSRDRAKFALEQVHAFWEKQSKEDFIEFYDRMEHGEKQASPELDVMAKLFREIMDHDKKDVQELGTGKLKEEASRPNYMPHYWDQPEEKVNSVLKGPTKRPLEGSKSFLKRRKIETLKEGIALGLTPSSWNPVDLVLAKHNEIQQFVMAHRWMNEYKEEGLAKAVQIGKDHPEDWVKINDKISTIVKSPMVAVQEAFDERMMTQLTDVAKSLGIDLERKTTLGKHKGMPAGVWGFSESKPGTPGKITSKFAGPESVIAHELGHQLDDIYGLQDKFLTPESEKEFTALANERVSDMEKADPKFLKYIQKPTERMAVMLESYIHAPELFKQVAPDLFSKFESFLKSKPELEPLTQIKPSLVMGVGESEVHAGGMVIWGHVWAQPDAARIMNNYLSEGFDKSKIYQALRFLGNSLTQMQLGISAFHLNFTSTEAIATQIDSALRSLASGKPLEAAGKAITSPIAPISTYFKGDRLLQAWRGKGQSPIDELIANAFEAGGGRAKNDQFYQTKMAEKFSDNFKKGRYIRGILSTPFAALDMISKPIFDVVVPHMKMGIFHELMEMELKNNPGMTHEEMRTIAGHIIDTIDDRMGQVIYDNLFWPKTFKQSLMLMVRSVGWNHGFVRLAVGGAANAVKALGQIAKGEKPEIGFRLSYWIASAITVFSLNALYQYLKTGKPPQELKDFVYPRNGGTDADGNPTRSIPFQNYFKDLHNWISGPYTTAKNKINAMWEIPGIALAPFVPSLNKDYFGEKYVNEDDPITKQVESEVKALLKLAEPFSISNMQRNLETKNRNIEGTIGPWLGDTPVRHDINQTPAQRLAHELAANHFEVGGRTEKQIQHSRLVSNLTYEFKNDNEQARKDIEDNLKSGQLSTRDISAIVTRSRMTPLQRTVHSLDLDEMRRVYQKANPEEKSQLSILLRRKEFNAQRGRVPQEVQ